jgi:prepilin-type N-terminal cleavage/methylation domain-containing protein
VKQPLQAADARPGEAPMVADPTSFPPSAKKTAHPHLCDVRCYGFTLLEVLVALAILGMAVTIVFQLFSANLKTLARSEGYVSAVVRAQERMQQVLDDTKLAEGSWSEKTSEGYQIDVNVTEALSERTQALPVRLFEVALTIRWQSYAREKSMTFRTLKMVTSKV